RLRRLSCDRLELLRRLHGLVGARVSHGELLVDVRRAGMAREAGAKVLKYLNGVSPVPQLDELRGGVVERRRADGGTRGDLLDPEEVPDGALAITRLPLRGALAVHGGRYALGEIGTHLWVQGELARLDEGGLGLGEPAQVVVRLADDGPGNSPLRLIGGWLARQEYPGDLDRSRQIAGGEYRLIGPCQHAGAVRVIRKGLRELDAGLDCPPPQVGERAAAQSGLCLLICRQRGVARALRLRVTRIVVRRMLVFRCGIRVVLGSEERVGQLVIQLPCIRRSRE